MRIESGESPQYDTGEWTPTLTFSTPGDLVRTYATQDGRWTRIGRLVVLAFELELATFTHTTAAGSMRIAGFPDTPSLWAGGEYLGSVMARGWAMAAVSGLALFVGHGEDYLRIRASRSALDAVYLSAAEFPSGGVGGFLPRVWGTIEYQIV